MVHVAFLRAVNVGSHNRIRMPELRSLFEELGYTDVRTHGQTGNVVFDAGREKAAKVRERIDAALAAHGLRGADAAVMTTKELTTLAATDPYAGSKLPKRLALLAAEPVPNLHLPHEEKGITFVSATKSALFAAYPDDLPRPPNPSALAERLWGVRATGRWWHVVQEIAATLRP